VTSGELFGEERSADVVAASFDATQDPRLRAVIGSLVRHLHAFVTTCRRPAGGRTCGAFSRRTTTARSGSARSCRATTSDGPVGALLSATGRHPDRPAHIHFLVEAGGYTPLTTHLFVADGPYLDSDAVFGVKPSLIREFATVEDPERAASLGLPARFRTVDFPVVLRRD
jgi:hypothetical protein